ncbi:hypothetical protein KQX54_017996 [Cotesia glomerata]|uniref:Uncharacterized protein n=1 Tax=Cotesia glomerata TaxID=32391 RepID=A0AAV7J8D0_COTGL|nr:hypothetical protein KQX54_017996 [Cotesia glomerata]
MKKVMSRLSSEARQCSYNMLRVIPVKLSESDIANSQNPCAMYRRISTGNLLCFVALSVCKGCESEKLQKIVRGMIWNTRYRTEIELDGREVPITRRRACRENLIALVFHTGLQFV